MARAKSGTKDGDIASSRWRETMTRKYGDISERMSEIGAIGGKVSTTGGFAADIPCKCPDIKTKHYIRNCAGMRGGIKSRRPKMSISKIRSEAGKIGGSSYSKLTDSQKKTIAASDKPVSRLAKYYNVSRTTIYKVKKTHGN